MIKLSDILKEISNGTPKAIFLAGPAGSGKTYISKQLLPSSYKLINSDDTYEELLKASGIGLKQKDFTPDQLSQAAKFQAQARKTTQDVLAKSIEDKNNIIIDGTGAASGPVLKKKKQLEDLGYETLMLMIYVSPLTSLERNQQRDRSLMPFIVLRTWRDVNKNVETYEQSFGENFILFNNDLESSNKGFSKELLKPYLQSSSAKGKPKTPEEIAKSAADKESMNQDIESMIKSLPKFDTIDLQIKIKILLNNGYRRTNSKRIIRTIHYNSSTIPRKIQTTPRRAL
jgi:dephospho-CoA kinase